MNPPEAVEDVLASNNKDQVSSKTHDNQLFTWFTGPTHPIWSNVTIACLHQNTRGNTLHIVNEIITSLEPNACLYQTTLGDWNFPKSLIVST